MKQGTDHPHWKSPEIMLVILAWIIAVTIAGAVIIKIRVLF